MGHPVTFNKVNLNLGKRKILSQKLMSFDDGLRYRVSLQDVRLISKKSSYFLLLVVKLPYKPLCPSVDWFDGKSVCQWSVSHNFRAGKLHFHAAIGALVYYLGLGVDITTANYSMSEAMLSINNIALATPHMKQVSRLSS